MVFFFLGGGGGGGGGGGHLPRGGSRNFFKVSSLMDAFRVSWTPSPSCCSLTSASSWSLLLFNHIL